ncbi:MAG TPA: acyl-CoA dehydrogenase family protein [Acidimicrobiia bacterium]|nr:acyl-CoA dehydrogenase family protein [Acidimicrobiia bacterium]
MPDQTETVEAFRLRAREWLAANMPVLAPDAPPPGRAEDDETWTHDRALQRRLWDGGFAGICFPKEYGGLGLSIEHQRAFTEESLPYEMPLHLNVPNFSILGATLVDFGTPEQNRKYVPPMLKGEHQWVQFLSEPTGGSDLAGCLTRAERDGDEWVLNGSKIWSTAAMSATHAMCLARTDWDAPKHRGLTMFIMEIHQDGVQVDRIKQVNGSLEFCQEFFDDVRLPPDSVVGDVNDGWTVALALLAHERNAVGGGSPYVSGRNYLAEGADGAFDASCVKIVALRGTSDDPVARQLLAEAHVLDVVQRGLVKRVSLGMETGALVGQSAAITKLFTATSAERKTTIRLELAGSEAVTWPTGTETMGRGAGEDFLERQATSLAGGSNEIQRNLIAERVLGMPREWAADRDIPYKDVRSNAMPASPGG